jgi:mono/diheme cytochrome c family protein
MPTHHPANHPADRRDKRSGTSVVILIVLLAALSSAQSVGDASRGTALFTKLKCVGCHTVRGQGGGTAPDLGQRTGGSYTPSLMAARMWDHAPEMWSAMKEQGVARPDLNAQDAADLFAYFYAARYFDPRGDVARGKALFAAKKCTQCHATDASGSGPGNPVSAWRSASDPVVLVQQMWRHFPQMQAAMQATQAGKKAAWVEITAPQLADLLAYVQDMQKAAPKPLQFSTASSDAGQQLFESKGCAACHQKAMALNRKLVDRNLTEVAAAMWNHAPPMQTATGAAAPRDINEQEMRQILTYVWASQFFEPPGDLANGRRIFVSYNCAACHENALVPSPKLPAYGTHYSVVSMIPVLWKHGPVMLQRIEQKNLPWPHFQKNDIADLAAYLSGPVAQPPSGKR